MANTIREENAEIIEKLTDILGFSEDYILQMLVDWLSSGQVSEFLEDFIRERDLKVHFPELEN